MECNLGVWILEKLQRFHMVKQGDGQHACFTGDIAANIYMVIPSSIVDAGNPVEFHAEYWSVDDEFESLSIGYSIQANMNYSITAVATNYTYTLDSTDVARELQALETKIATTKS